MHPIVSRLQNPPRVDFHKRKLLLNEEFNQKAIIKGLVSYIYYPTQYEYPVLGHAELEIEGRSFTLMVPSYYKMSSLTTMIRSSVSGFGYPFFRFSISVTPLQLEALSEKSQTTTGPFCAMGAFKALSNYGQFSVPKLVTFFPVVSALYLSSVRLLGSKRVTQIEFYGEKSHLNNVMNGITGVAVECLGIYSLIDWGVRCVSSFT